MIEFKLPELGENIDQGDLVRLMVAPGATVNAGQSVMELETDKAVVEVPSSVSGTVQEIRVKEGDKIKVGQVIFTVDGADGKSAAVPAKQEEPEAKPAKAAPQKPAAKKKLPSLLLRLPLLPSLLHRHQCQPLLLHLRRLPLLLRPPVRASSRFRNSARTFRKEISFV